MLSTVKLLTEEIVCTFLKCLTHVCATINVAQCSHNFCKIYIHIHNFFLWNLWNFTERKLNLFILVFYIMFQFSGEFFLILIDISARQFNVADDIKLKFINYSIQVNHSLQNLTIYILSLIV